MTSCQSCQGYVNDNPVIVSRVHSQFCHSVQRSFTILSLCPEFIHNPVIVSRAHSQSCHSVQGPFTILSMCLGFIHNHSCCFRAGPLFWGCGKLTIWLLFWDVTDLADLGSLACLLYPLCLI